MDREFVDKVLSLTNIVDVISSYVPLKQKGNTYWGCCPFHNEKTPSFAVNEQKQFYHCFGCKESGDAIKFIMKTDNVDFMTALEKLADRAGLAMPQQFSTKGVDREKKQRLYELTKCAARHYHENLYTPAASAMLDYLHDRQIPDSMVTRFGLGASLSFNELPDYLAAQGYTHEEMKEAGLCEKSNGRWYDVYAKRVIFPIIDNAGNVVAFGGRAIETTEYAKYRNTSNTALFDKSRTIYAINLLKKRKAAAPIDRIIMVEGYMDVIALHKAGFDTAVASMGTALTSGQARQLKIYCDKIYISYDGDTAGQKATMRGLDILQEAGLDVRVVKLPDGKDPDDVIKQGGASAYQALLDGAVPLTEFKIDTTLKAHDLSDPEERAKAAVAATEFIKTLENAIDQSRYIDYLSSRTGYTREVLQEQADIPTLRATAPITAPPVTNDAAYDKAVDFVLASIINDQSYASFDFDLEPYFLDEFSKHVYRIARDNSAREFAKVFDEEIDNARISKLLEYEFVKGDGEMKFRECARTIVRESLSAEKAMLVRKYDETKDIEYLRQSKEVDDKIARLNEIKELK